MSVELNGIAHIQLTVNDPARNPLILAGGKHVHSDACKSEQGSEHAGH